jgi:lysophospholipase L1-like esterase
VRWIALITLASGVSAQAPDSERVTLLERETAAQRRLLRDWAGLIRYGSENTEIRPPAAGENRVVFLGDQITESWGRGGAPFFPGKPYLNRGISRQTTAQLLVRFRQDVISLKPKVTVIQGGTNDLAGVFGPATEEMVAENFMSMTELAKAHGIRVVIASLTPVCACFDKQKQNRPPARSIELKQEKIAELNELLKDYAAGSGAVYLDYYSALADGNDLKEALTSDGQLPNDAGYKIMAVLAERAITEALRRK